MVGSHEGAWQRSRPLLIIDAMQADDPQRLPALAKLLDEALSVPELERAPWLATVAARTPELHASLLKLLASHEAAEAEDYLNTTLGLGHDAPAHDQAAPIQLGPYQLLRKLGDGGMSSVWLAERSDGQFDGQVAIKLLPPALAAHAGFRERLQHEAHVLGKLSHPHIAKLFDAGVAGGDGGTPYLVLELVQGQSITAHCDAHQLDLRERLRLMVQVCEAVGYLHGNLVIHRDIKPSNIMVDATGNARLVDFGIAKVIGDAQVASDITTAHGSAFTPDYAAPEQIRGATLTTAADVYALGAVLYRLLTGVKPHGAAAASSATRDQASLPSRPSAVFGGTSKLPPQERETLAHQRGTNPLRLQRLMRDELDVVVLKALAHDPADRYPSATSLAADLSAYLRGMPISAKRPTWRYTVQKFASRNRLSVALGSLAMVTVLGLTGVTFWQAQRASAEAQRAGLEAARSKKVLAFITTLLGKSNPNETDGKRITVTELIKGALPDVQKQFADDPSAHREVLVAMADVLRTTEDYPEALEILQAQLAHATQHHGSQSLAVAQDELAMGMALSSIGRHPESIERLKRAIRVLETLGHTQHQSYLEANTALASSLFAQLDYAQARQVASKAERLYPHVRDLGHDKKAWFAEAMQFVYSSDIKESARWLEVMARDPAMTSTQGSIRQAFARCSHAYVLAQVGKLNEALVVKREALQALERLTGKNSLVGEPCLVSLGVIESDLALYADAQKTMQRTLDLAAISKSEVRQQRIAQDYGLMGALALRTLDMDQAKRYQKLAQDAVTSKQALPMPSAMWLDVQLATIEGRWPDADAALAELKAVADARVAAGGDEFAARWTMHGANAMRLRGKAPEAVTALTETVAKLKAYLPYQDARVARIQGYLAMALMDAGRHGDAAQLARESAAIAAQWLAPDHPLTLQLQYVQAQALDKLGQRVDASALMQSTQKAFKARLGEPLNDHWMRVLY
jgi:eukaryotic-like serine/threonine-protein kinase